MAVGNIYLISAIAIIGIYHCTQECNAVLTKLSQVVYVFYP